MRSPEGGYSEKHLPISEERAYTLTARERDEVYTLEAEADENGVAAPRHPRPAAAGPGSRRLMFADNVQKPTREELEEAHHHAEHEHELQGPMEGHPASGHEFDGHNQHETTEMPLRPGH